MSICQTATKTATEKDSTVVMSKKLVGYMIEDLIKSDADKQAIKLLEQNLDFKDKVIGQKDDIISRHDASMKAKNDLIQEYESNEKDMTIAMEKLKADLNKKKQGNIFWKSAAAGLLVGLVVNHYAWKYGGKQ
jgi:uncharacterized protein (DUF3084 family)